jgi:hypothetical protein
MKPAYLAFALLGCAAVADAQPFLPPAGPAYGMPLNPGPGPAVFGGYPGMMLGQFGSYYPGGPPYGGYGGYGGLGPYGGYSGYGAYSGLGAYSPYGYGRYGGYGYGSPLAYAQQLFQMQGAQTQQIFQQQQQAIIAQLGQAQQRVAGLDQIKKQMFAEFLQKSESEQAKVRASLARDYVGMSDDRRSAWQRDPVVKLIMGSDNWWQRLEGVISFLHMDRPQQRQFQATLLSRYQALPADQQSAWQHDSAIQIVMGRDGWWQ